MPAKKRYRMIPSLFTLGLILTACTVTSSTLIDPYPGLTQALESEKAWRCEVSCDAHEAFAASGLSPEQAKALVDNHNRVEHGGGTNHTKASCELGPVEK